MLLIHQPDLDLQMFFAPAAPGQMTHAVCKCHIPLCLAVPGFCWQCVCRFLGRDFLLIKLSSPTCCSHKAACPLYVKTHALIQPQMSRGECILESNKYDKGKTLLIHLIISPAAFPFPGDSPGNVNLRYCHLIFEIALEIQKRSARVFSV